MSDDWKFREGQRVLKPQGYPFPGIIDSAFLTQAGEPRYVVEFCSEVTGEPTGLCHIFNGGQLVRDRRYDDAGVLIKPVRDTRVDPEIAVAQARAAMLSRQGLKPPDKPLRIEDSAMEDE